MRRLRGTVGLLWPALGLLGAATTAAAATRLLSRRPVAWWWRMPFLHGHGVSWHLFWAGVILLCAAWLGLGWRAQRAADVRPRDIAIVGALWSLPLALGPALFSLDLYSYLAQGALMHHGLNPYHYPPSALGWFGQNHLVSLVSSSWRDTTAPYGPVFLAIAGWIAAAAGHHLTLGVTLLRIPELAGLGLLAVFTPRLARALGADPVRATWLAVASPLSLLLLIGGGHNDALMAGLLVAGVALAAERRPLVGIGLCVLAATIKLPAVAGAAVIAVCWLRAAPHRRPQVLLSSAALAVGIVVLAGWLTGVGLTWISGDLFSTPAAVRTALTPATATAVTVYAIAHGGAHPGVGVDARMLESLAADVAIALTLCYAAWLGLRVRPEALARALGLMLLAAALGGPAAWPWYLSWGVVILAADPAAQRSRWLLVLVVAAVFPVMAGGQVAIALPQAPRMFVLYALAAAIAGIQHWRRRGLAGPRLPVPERQAVPRPEAAG